MSKLSQSIFTPAGDLGLIAAANFLQIPIASTDELGERAGAILREHFRLLMERWDNEQLPRIKQVLRRLETMNITHVVSSHIPVLLDEAFSLIVELRTIAFVVQIPSAEAGRLFDELYADLVGDGVRPGRELLIGLPSELRKADAGLSDLAGAARVTGLDRLLLTTPANKAMSALVDEPMGEYFAAAIRDYLNEYGGSQDLSDLSDPTWKEAPTTAISKIQEYLRSGYDARAEHEIALRSAVTALSAARAEIAARPEGVRRQFDSLVIAARNGAFLLEESEFFIEGLAHARLRAFFLRLGTRLKRIGVLARADDVFMFTLDELKSLSSRTPSEEEICSARMQVFEREAELEQLRLS